MYIHSSLRHPYFFIRYHLSCVGFFPYPSYKIPRFLLASLSVRVLLKHPKPTSVFFIYTPSILLGKAHTYEVTSEFFLSLLIYLFIYSFFFADKFILLLSTLIFFSTSVILFTYTSLIFTPIPLAIDKNIFSKK